ncbi:MAG: cell division ATP-binding protein FtsE [Armatimonadetes bacterium]|nr:MAG: cell division ATP-binding protein FtsE [Armatimonadota bacterium]
MIKLENVTKTYPGGTVAVKDASLEIAKGEFVFLVGASGSGKSTLIRLMMREEQPTNGDLWVAGKHASELPSWKVPHLRRSIGTVFQDFKLLPNKTVYENVAFAMEVTGKHRSVIRNQVPQVLKLVGLSSKTDRLPRQLSGGEQQRVAVARAFVNRPLILLADEPTGNLDPATSVGIMRILDRINRTGTTVVMATHDHAIVDAMRRRVVEIDRGRIMRDESRGIYETALEPTVPVTTEVQTAVEDVAPVEPVEAFEEFVDEEGSSDTEATPEPEVVSFEMVSDESVEEAGDDDTGLGDEAQVGDDA